MNIFSIASILAFSTCITLASVVYLKDMKSIVNKSFAVLTFLIGIWCLFPFVSSLPVTDTKSLLYARFVYIAAIFVPPIYLHFVFSLIGISYLKKEKVTLAIFYLTSCIFLIFCLSPSFIKDLSRSAHYFSVVPGKVYFAFILFFTMMAFLGHYKFFVEYKKSTGYKRNQFLYVFFAFFIASIAGFMHFSAAYGIEEIFPHDFLIILFTTVIAYAVLRYRLMDINFVIKKTVVYSISAGVLTGLFIISVLTTTELLSSFIGISSFAISVIFALIIALIFAPVKAVVQKIVDKLFCKKTYDYYATIQKVSHELASTLKLRKIYSFVGDTILSTLGLKNIYLLSTVQDGSYRIVYSTYVKDKATKDEGTMTPAEKDALPELSNGVKTYKDSEVVKLLENSKDIVIREELPQMPKISQEVLDNVNTDLMPFKGEVVVPVFIDDKLELLMVLGGKLSGDIFTDEDIKLLNTISDQTAIAIKNAKLYIDKLRSERLASIGIMSATFAHEIKNPLASIKTFAQLLPERYSDIDLWVKFSKIVMDSVNNIDGLITDLMGLSSGRLSSRMSTLNITGLIDQSIDEIKANLELGKKKIKIEKDYKDVKIDISGDEKRLRHAFINIIINGCQAIPEGQDDGTLRVSINQNKENVDILITDNGDGIPMKDVPKVFEPFFSKKEVGRGLGLAIAKKIIEGHNGKIGVESKLKKGTTFKITLPAPSPFPSPPRGEDEARGRSEG